MRTVALASAGVLLLSEPRPGGRLVWDPFKEEVQLCAPGLLDRYVGIGVLGEGQPLNG